MFDVRSFIQSYTDVMIAYQRPTNNPQLLTLHHEIFNGLFG